MAAAVDDLLHRRKVVMRFPSQSSIVAWLRRFAYWKARTRSRAPSSSRRHRHGAIDAPMAFLQALEHDDMA
jgi:uncharacterized protein (DUF1330 family)